jgi:hypothetical protein
MIVAQVVESRTTRVIPNAQAILAGQAVTRTGATVTSNAGAPVALGIAEHDLPAFVPGPQVNAVTYNHPRTLTVATEGRLAIRVGSGQFTSIAPGAPISLFNGEAVQVGAGGTAAATTLSGTALIVDEKLMGADGVGYVLVYIY